MNLFNEKTLEGIKNKLLKSHETIAVAESVTSGFIQLAFSTAKDASKFYQGGITAYNIGQKYKHLHVEPIHANGCNCVSGKVATEMALNVCRLFESDWGLGITGYAAPVEESDNKLFAYYAIAYKDKVVAQKKLVAKQEDSFEVQLSYVNHLLDDLKEHLIKKQPA